MDSDSEQNMSNQTGRNQVSDTMINPGAYQCCQATANGWIADIHGQMTAPDHMRVLGFSLWLPHQYRSNALDPDLRLTCRVEMNSFQIWKRSNKISIAFHIHVFDRNSRLVRRHLKLVIKSIQLIKRSHHTGSMLANSVWIAHDIVHEGVL